MMTTEQKNINELVNAQSELLRSMDRTIIIVLKLLEERREIFLEQAAEKGKVIKLKMVK